MMAGETNPAMAALDESLEQASEQDREGGFAGLLRTPGVISEQDVSYMRREVFRDGIVSRTEAETVFAMNNGATQKCAEWNQFFLEALTDYLVHQAEPRGYVSVANAEWLISMVTHDGHVELANEVELLVKVLDASKQSPETLIAFVLGEVARCVLDGEGLLANGATFRKGVIGEPETELLRRALYAFGGESGISISRVEAEILFDLNDRSVQAENHPAWRELFVKAIGNYLMAASAYRAIPRAEALVREEWLEDNEPDVKGALAGAFLGLGKLFSAAFLDDLTDAHTQIENAWKARNERVAAEMAVAEQISDDEAEWLIEKLTADGIIHENEKSLLSFIRRECPDLHPSLHPWLEKNAANGG